MNKQANWVIYKLLTALPVLLMLTGAAKLHDPTRPPNAPNTTSSTNEQANQMGDAVTAIFDYPDYRAAIINNRLVKVGDRIGEFTITSITPYTVELTGTDNSKRQLDIVSAVKERIPSGR